MKNEDPWFFDLRAEAYAKLVLTEQHDVRSYDGSDVGVDLLVEIRTNNAARPRRFGVQLVPYLDLPDLKDADERVLSHFGRNSDEATLPVCAFVIGVRKPEGVYRWIVEPVVADEQAVLRRDVPADWHPLDGSSVGCLIAQVNAWYDALNGAVPVKARGPRSKTQA
jgi:hypothetical protein